MRAGSLRQGSGSGHPPSEHGKSCPVKQIPTGPLHEWPVNVPRVRGRARTAVHVYPPGVRNRATKCTQVPVKARIGQGVDIATSTHRESRSITSCRAHCSGCGAHFASVRAMDLHRKGSHKDGRSCEYPGYVSGLTTKTSRGTCQHGPHPTIGVVVWTLMRKGA